jgi:hypothetical protein
MLARGRNYACADLSGSRFSRDKDDRRLNPAVTDSTDLHVLLARIDQKIDVASHMTVTVGILEPLQCVCGFFSRL